MEALTILEGDGEAWMEGGDPFPVKPGMTLVFPAHTRHWFRALGSRPLKTCGVHGSPHRIVIEHEE
jgi:mannose-6-phosphate isomerase-like protein (cupin superfamily)